MITDGGLLLSGQDPLQPRDAKEIIRDAEIKYGPPPELVNGETYYYPYYEAKGDPFFKDSSGNTASRGSVVTGKVEYPDQQIRFDILNQQLILDFRDRAGASKSLVLNQERVDCFSLGGVWFRKFPDEEGRERFGQFIHGGRIACYFLWEKELDSGFYNGEERYTFTSQNRVIYLVKGRSGIPCSSNRKFLKIIPEEIKVIAKQYMRDHKIRLRKAGEEEMEDLMAFVNQHRVHGR